MNIVHILSQNQLTGAEVYATQLIQNQLSHGHTVHQFSNEFFVTTGAEQLKLPVETKSLFEFLKTVFVVRAFLKKYQIQVVHTHSRAAAKLAFWSRLFLKVGLVATVHGRQHPSISKKLFNQYGDFLIAVCETLHFQLRFDFGYNLKRLCVIRNPFLTSQFGFSFKPIPQKFALNIAIVGRTTGPKGQRSQQVLNALPEILKSLGTSATYYLVGGSKKDLQLNHPDLVLESHVSPLTGSDYQRFDIVIGSGRVAIEAVLVGVPTIAFGEAKYIGLVQYSNLKENYVSNFGDMDAKLKEPLLPVEKLRADLTTLIMNPPTEADLKQTSEQLEKDYSAEKIYKQVMRLYQSSFFLRNYSKWIPILMYHKIPKAELESKHKIFVIESEFRKHLQYFKRRGFQTLTFSDLKKFKDGDIDFSLFPKKPLILTFDDGYRDNLENASPLLQEFGFKAQLFLLANSEIKDNEWDVATGDHAHEIISGSERLKWKDSAFEIGSHGISHQKITQMTEPEARAELKNSKQLLETEFGTEIPVFAFTYGDTHAKAAMWAREEGYDFAVNTDTGGMILEEDPYKIFRVNIFPHETVSSLFKKTSSWYRGYYFWKRKK